MVPILFYSISKKPPKGFKICSSISEKLTDQKHITNSWQVSEEVTSAFISADINTEFANMALTGNIGLRYIHTKQSSHI